MTRNLPVLILFFGITHAYATHIVGGEFELEHLNGYNYQVRMILYFDVFHGNVLAEDPNANVGIFRKRDNRLISTFTLNNMGSTKVEYTNPICVIAELNTKKILYRTNVYLSPEIYNDPEGYYLVWERCCRNNVIENIYSPGATAQTFYLEFPPVIVDGQPFINSTPILFPPLSDYACVNRDFYADFTGIDKDGDSLVYSLTEPWSGHTTTLNPVLNFPLPGPYSVVNWLPGIDMLNMIPGNPSLQISSQGILKVRAKMEGLFVFAVKCEEFRDGVKIGEVRRDFQMLVIECHKPGSPPSAIIQVGDNPPTSEIDTIRITPGNPACFKMWVTDVDVPETIRFRATPVNFSGRLNNLFSAVSGVVTSADDPLIVDLCLPGCALTDQRYAIIDLIAMDDECSIPLMDTVRLVIDYTDMINTEPYFTFQSDTLNYTLDHSKPFSIPIEGRDDEGAVMTMEWTPNNFDPSRYWINFEPLENNKGLLRYNFNLETNCSQYDFSGTDTLQITFILIDADACGNILTSQLVLNLMPNLPDNRAPIITLDSDIANMLLNIGEEISFPVLAEDPDLDTIVLTAQGINFNLQDYGIVFVPKEGKGSVSSTFSWNPDCNVNINQKDEFKVVLTARDKDLCQTGKMDTETVTIKLSPPLNREPRFVSELNALNEISIGELLELEIMAVDDDGDRITLDLQNREELKARYNIEFEPKEGLSSVSSLFRYTGDCSHLGEGFSSTEMDLVFMVGDDKCYNPKTNTVSVKVLINDPPSKREEFLPPNVFTPNGDEYNPYFTMPNLPNNNCGAQFSDITIYNRWGMQVFGSTDRDFVWDGGNSPAGVYYYIVKFSTYTYTGVISIIK